MSIAAMPSASRPWLLKRGKERRPGSRLQRGIRRAFIATGARQLPTGALMRFCYPRGHGGYRQRYHYRHIWKAASKICICLGRQPNTPGRPNVWMLK